MPAYDTNNIFAKILRLPMAYFDRNAVGRLLTRVGSDVDAMQRLLTDGLIGLATDLVMLAGVLKSPSLKMLPSVSRPSASTAPANSCAATRARAIKA